METFKENLPLAKEKMLDMKDEDRLALAAWSDTASERVVVRLNLSYYNRLSVGIIGHPYESETF
jgi:hypothetical protein